MVVAEAGWKGFKLKNSKLLVGFKLVDQLLVYRP